MGGNKNPIFRKKNNKKFLNNVRINSGIKAPYNTSERGPREGRYEQRR
jgi:hypothetical protein